MDWSEIWTELNLDKLEEELEGMFPQININLRQLLELVFTGNIKDAFHNLFGELVNGIGGQISGFREIFAWLLILGLVSALAGFVTEIFENHQVADISFFFAYLLFTAVLLRCFGETLAIASELLENIVLFSKLVLPAYLMTIGLAGGAMTAGISCQFMLVIISVLEIVIGEGMLPFIYSYLILSVVNGLWSEDKLGLLAELIDKAINYVLKGAVGIITGLGIFQTLLAPIVDGVRASVLEKVVQSIPGVGGLASGALELVLGSAILFKNSFGIVILLLMIFLCAVPLLKIGLMAGMLKLAAAFLSIVSDKRIAVYTNRVGDAHILLFKTASTAMLLFLIAVAAIASATLKGTGVF